MHIRKRCEVVDCVDLAQDIVQLLAFMNMVKLIVPKNQFLDQLNINFQRKTLCHGVCYCNIFRDLYNSIKNLHTFLWPEVHCAL
jgi:hypothetical protein